MVQGEVESNLKTEEVQEAHLGEKDAVTDGGKFREEWTNVALKANAEGLQEAWGEGSCSEGVGQRRLWMLASLQESRLSCWLVLPLPCPGQDLIGPIRLYCQSVEA